jgi:hypothetical protein
VRPENSGDALRACGLRSACRPNGQRRTGCIARRGGPGVGFTEVRRRIEAGGVIQRVALAQSLGFEIAGDEIAAVHLHRK